VTLKPGVGVFQGHWKWRRSTYHNTTSYWSATVSIGLSCTVFQLLTSRWIISWPWNLG